jgi:hypothetical protein
MSSFALQQYVPGRFDPSVMLLIQRVVLVILIIFIVATFNRSVKESGQTFAQVKINILSDQLNILQNHIMSLLRDIRDIVKNNADMKRELEQVREDIQTLREEFRTAVMVGANGERYTIVRQRRPRQRVRIE